MQCVVLQSPVHKGQLRNRGDLLGKPNILQVRVELRYLKLNTKISMPPYRKIADNPTWEPTERWTSIHIIRNVG
jgi:hypothetical protein